MTSSIRDCAYTAYDAVTSPSDKDEWSTVKRKMQRGGRLLGTTMVVSLLFAALGSASGGVSGAATLSIRHANGTPILIGSEAPLTNPAISFPRSQVGDAGCSGIDQCCRWSQGASTAAGLLRARS